MKLTSLLSVKEDAPVQQEHALLTLLKNAGQEIKKDIDYDFSDGTMDYHRDLMMNHTNSPNMFSDHGRCLAEASEILDHVDNEKIVLLVAGYDGNWEDAYIVPTNSEMLVKKANQEGMYLISFRGTKFTFTREEAEKVFADYIDTKLFEYERIGERIERSWDDDFDEDTPRSVYAAASRRWMNREDDYDDLDENDYKFEKESMYGALIYKDLHHH